MHWHDARWLIAMQTPFRVRILQCGEVLNPISRVEINAVPMLIHIFPHLRLMDVPTDHILIANRQVGGVASVGAQVNIRNDDYVYVAFLHAAK